MRHGCIGGSTLSCKENKRKLNFSIACLDNESEDRKEEKGVERRRNLSSNNFPISLLPLKEVHIENSLL